MAQFSKQYFSLSFLFLFSSLMKVTLNKLQTEFEYSMRKQVTLGDRSHQFYERNICKYSAHDLKTVENLCTFKSLVK